jgi:competence protein ComEA
MIRRTLTAASLGLALSLSVMGRQALVSARQDAATPTPSAEGLPEGPGREVTAKVCGICHEARRAASVRLTREGWDSVIQAMVQRGARGTPEELAQVLDYLATNFLGEAPRPVSLNSAPQIDLETVIGLLRREAAALVQYREKNGPFKTLEEVKAVPGVDYRKIEAAKDRIAIF